MAQIIELLGDFPLEVKMGGKYSRELFDHTGLSLASFSVLPALNIAASRCSPVYPLTETVATETCDD